MYRSPHSGTNYWQPWIDASTNDDKYSVNLAKVIAAWLGGTKHNRIFVARSGSVHELHILNNTQYNGKPRQFEHSFAIIGDSWVAVPPGIHIEAADPEFFTKLEAAIKTVENHR